MTDDIVARRKERLEAQARENETFTTRLGAYVYTLCIVDGEVVIDQLTAKEAAIDEIRAQPFFASNA